MLVRYKLCAVYHEDHMLTISSAVLSMEDLSKTPFLILGNKIDRKPHLQLYHTVYTANST
jgi:GTPase SAR1 family protein